MSLSNFKSIGPTDLEDKWFLMVLKFLKPLFKIIRGKIIKNSKTDISLERDLWRNVSVKYHVNWTSDLMENDILNFFFKIHKKKNPKKLKIWFFKTIWTNLIKNLPRNIPVKSGANWTNGSREDVWRKIGKKFVKNSKIDFWAPFEQTWEGVPKGMSL